MRVNSESPLFEEKVKNEIYEISYGLLKKGSPTRVEIIIEGVSFLSYSKSCQCVAPVITILDKGIKIVVSYDSKKLGTINQYTEIQTIDADNKIHKTRIKLKGQII